MFERSYHFIPADRPNLFDRVATLGADAYIFDLEDAVSRDNKARALQELDQWFDQQGNLSHLFVRLNGHNDSLAGSERDFIKKYPALGIILPKVTSAGHLLESVEFYQLDQNRRMIGLIEDARGLYNINHILELKLLDAVGLGLEDFLSGSIFETSQVDELVDHIRCKITLAAMAWGVDAIDTISLDLSGGDEIESDVASSRSSGFNGKFSIHPSQVKAINNGLSPSAAILEKASVIAEKMTFSNTESGYQLIAGEILSPPKLKKLHIINSFREYHESTNR